jgi:drug/metabolite transporter (DMT)-like permease
MSATTPLVERPSVSEQSSHLQRREAPAVWLVIAAFAAVYLIWGSTYLGIRIAIESVPPFLMASARFMIAGAVLYAVMRLRGAARPSAAHWREAAVIGGLLLVLGNGGVSWAELRVPTNITALMVAGTPLWMIVIDWLRPRGQRPHGFVFLGLALGFAGVGLIVMSRDAHGHGVMDPWGALILLAASVSWAGGSIYSRHARKPDSALLAIAMQMMAGGALMFISSLCLGELHHWHWQEITARSAGAFVYLTFLGSLVGFPCYVWLLQVSTPARVSTYAYVNPLIAVVLGRVVLGEVLPAGALAAGGFILAAVVLITVKGRAR